MTRSKTVVVLFNLGGPDGQADVKGFLTNLFSDPAIIGLPDFARLPLARFIAARREKAAQANYQLMGGGSPLLPETRRQAEALQLRLAEILPDREIRIEIAMRYWSPLTEEVVARLEADDPDEIVLLPLYPQFSTTTTGSSMARFKALYKGRARLHSLCCFPTEPAFVEAHVSQIGEALEKNSQMHRFRLLFSAHGLPESVIRKGDPYQAQIESSVAAIIKALGGGMPHTICYQSRVGPLKWIGPSTEEAIKLAGQVGEDVVVVPIAFVSEHIETLVELDRDYAHVAAISGVRNYVRVPALGLQTRFIEALATGVIRALKSQGPVISAYQCAHTHKACPRLQLGNVSEVSGR